MKGETKRETFSFPREMGVTNFFPRCPEETDVSHLILPAFVSPTAPSSENIFPPWFSGKVTTHALSGGSEKRHKSGEKRGHFRVTPAAINPCRYFCLLFVCLARHRSTRVFTAPAAQKSGYYYSQLANELRGLLQLLVYS